ncbi:ABC transporter ATP-binding protein [Piscinibacter sp. XHJ-5]|uniref:ABC transporter ATP-binding protein n=1 Tax=Piscinibacter sp. XHJ-5 TaxID=3037797 RepID=UPI0024530D02|nr:ABC transporter ATP-binding protein [Piscinibacter sp. XHJ-5]
MSERALISLQSVDKQFANGVWALRGATLQVVEGEFVSLLGPSGCGKSTVLRLVAGLDTASAGHVVAAPGHGGTGFVFQEPTLMPWASVSDNVWLPLRLAGRSRREARERVHALLQTVGLAEFAHAFPAELSGGMKMRASIARALVTQPRVLLMDEPFAALDEITRQRLNDDLLRWWQSQPLTTLFVTHSVFEAIFLSQRVVVMSARPGRVVADVAIDEPYPRHAGFRTSTHYAQLCRELSKALERAMHGQPAPERQ